MIATHEAFCLSIFMSCTFHAIWYPFKQDIYNLLPSKNSPKGKIIELTNVGKLCGKYFLILTINSIGASNIKQSHLPCGFIISNLSLCNLSASGVCLLYKGTIQ
jgi:hypothetical protein